MYDVSSTVEEPAEVWEYNTSSNCWKCTEATVRVAKRNMLETAKYSVMMMRDLKNKRTMVLKFIRDIDKEGKLAYDTVRKDAVGEMIASLFRQCAPRSCQPKYVSLVYLPNSPLTQAQARRYRTRLGRLLGI